MSDTPTPRTDAAQFFVSTTPKQSPDEGGMFVEVDFARQLERELAECEKELAETKKALKALTFPHEAVEGTWPLILYFASAEEANGFEQAVLAAQPNLKPHQL